MPGCFCEMPSVRSVENSAALSNANCLSTILPCNSPNPYLPNVASSLAVYNLQVSKQSLFPSMNKARNWQFNDTFSV